VTVVAPSVEEGRFRGEPAVIVRAGGLSATFLPDLGMTGVSLRCRGREHLALPGGLPALRAGATLGLPLLAPWANRLGSRRYRAAGVDVDLTGLPLGTDANGLPIHGLLVGKPGWRLDRSSAGRGRAGFQASIDVDGPAFPYRHRIEVSVIADEQELLLDTTVIPTGRRRVPVAFGWHPYLRPPGTPRTQWHLRLPARTHLALDKLGLPTAISQREARENEPIGRRTFDDLYLLGRERRLALVADDSSIELRCGPGYPYAQVWVPAGRPFAALEPMTTATNSLVDGTAPLVEPGDAFTARFTLGVEGAQ
jgi:aldose 1-epimerase